MEVKELILDYSKWRCGDNGEHKVGQGGTALLNMEGFMCCLGQWSLQLGATEKELLGKDEPNEIQTLIPLFAKLEEYSYEEYNEEIDDYVLVTVNEDKISTNFSLKAMEINDDRCTTPEEKIQELTELLVNHGIALKVINKPS